jgi:hypothetical protein
MIGFALMILEGIVVAAAARARLRVQWRWLGIGAALWLVVLVFKVTVLPVLEPPIWRAMEIHFSRRVYLVVGAAFGGLTSGGMEVLVTVAAGLCWRHWSASARRAVAIGIGAGTGEAVILGALGMVTELWSVLRGVPLPGSTLLMALWFPAIRLVSIPGHVAVRAMTLYAIATRRWHWFWVALGFFTINDALFTLIAMTDPGQRTGSGTVLLTQLGFAAASLPLIFHIWQRWPESTTDAIEERRVGGITTHCNGPAGGNGPCVS